jgi:glycerophosphoryl diester phosphodiesterase
MKLVNQDRAPTIWGVPRLEEMLKDLKGRCYINLDKFWNCPDEIAALVRKLGMQDQVLIKTSASEENFARVEAVASDLPYMVIAREDNFSDDLLRRNMRYAGVEALFTSEDAAICQPEYLAAMRDKGLVTWANSIVYNYKTVLSAGHTDDIAVSEDPDYGWGWLLDRGFRIIQTDWPLALKQYLQSRKG